MNNQMQTANGCSKDRNAAFKFALITKPFCGPRAYENQTHSNKSQRNWRLCSFASNKFFHVFGSTMKPNNIWKYLVDLKEVNW